MHLLIHPFIFLSAVHSPIGVRILEASLQS
jgi:hypothetical protein